MAGTRGAAATAPVVIVEIEHKYDVPDDFDLDGLSAGLLELPGVAGVSPARVLELEAGYFDTADLRLLAARRTLRRRVGGVDDGWHLKEPGKGAGRRETLLPLGRSARVVPARLRRAVAVYTRGLPLLPVARLFTERTVVVLTQDDGAPIAEVMLDRVRALALDENADEHEIVWQELEVELAPLPGEEEPVLSQPLHDRVLAAGAVPSASVSKLARALAGTGRRPTGRGAGAGAGTGDGAGDGLGGDHGLAVRTTLEYLRNETRHLISADPGARADVPDAVHQMRVACRRLRSALAVYRPMFAEGATVRLRAELRWLATELGPVRDLEVIREELLTDLSREPARMRPGPIRTRVRRELTTRYRAAHDEAITELDSARYFRLLDTLETFVEAPPLAPGAERLGRKFLIKRVNRAWRRMRRFHDELLAIDAPAGQPAPGDDAVVGENATGETVTGETVATERPRLRARDEVMHDIRKAAKRARYAGESVNPVFGDDARTFSSAMSRIQTVLGDHQDSVVLRAELLDLAAVARAAGEDTFGYGRLHALQQARAERTDADFEKAWEALAGLTPFRPQPPP